MSSTSPVLSLDSFQNAVVFATGEQRSAGVGVGKNNALEEWASSIVNVLKIEVRLQSDSSAANSLEDLFAVCRVTRHPGKSSLIREKFYFEKYFVRL